MNLRRISALLIVLAACDAPPAGRSCKPRAPIALTADLSGDPLSACLIRAEASCEAGDIELEVVLPEGMTHLRGARRAVGRRAIVEIRARAADRTPRVVFIRATLREGEGRLTRVVSLPTEKPEVGAAGILKRNARGETILELTP